MFRTSMVCAVLTSALPTFASGAPAAPIRVYVFTAESTGATADDGQGRIDSVRDLQDALRGKSQFTLVSGPDEAQVVVEVLNREERDVSGGGFGGKSLTRFRETLLRVRVKAGNDQSELKGSGRASWTSAAKDVVNRLSKWVKNHGIGG
jgi:hypothetical protein